jgi:hypothetical protein
MVLSLPPFGLYRVPGRREWDAPPLFAGYPSASMPMRGRSPTARDYVLAGVAIGCLFLGISLCRFIDGDEGFYLVASRLVMEGKRPYGDFFYLQMPVLPYAFATWMTVVGAGWYTARILAALLATGIGVLVFHCSARLTRSLHLAVLASILYAACGLSIGWYSVVKTYGVSELLLLSACALAGSRRPGALLACGLCLGLATSVRLYMIVAAPCVALYLLREIGWNRASLVSIGWVAGGVMVGLLPCAPFLLRDREAFLFDTITFHSLRYPKGGEGFFGGVGQKWQTVLSLLGLRHSEGTGGIQFLLLLAAAAVGIFGATSPRNSLIRYLWIVLGATSLLPNPTFNQYFCLIVPLLAIGIVERLHAASPFGKSISLLLGLALVAYVTLGALDARRFVATGERVPGIESPANAINWSIPTVRVISRGIDRVGAEQAASWWPGYFAFTRTQIVMDMANDFGIRAAPRLSAIQRARYHIPTYDDITRMIRTGSPRVFVEGNWSPDGLGQILFENGYRVRGQVARTRIWEHATAGG